MSLKFRFAITHSLIGVFTNKPDNCLNDWTDEHVKQGFTWRPSSVAFGLGMDCGWLDVEVEIVAELSLREEAMRIIQVPFEADFP